MLKEIKKISKSTFLYNETELKGLIVIDFCGKQLFDVVKILRNYALKMIAKNMRYEYKIIKKITAPILNNVLNLWKAKGRHWTTPTKRPPCQKTTYSKRKFIWKRGSRMKRWFLLLSKAVSRGSAAARQGSCQKKFCIFFCSGGLFEWWYFDTVPGKWKESEVNIDKVVKENVLPC